MGRVPPPAQPAVFNANGPLYILPIKWPQGGAWRVEPTETRLFPLGPPSPTSDWRFQTHGSQWERTQARRSGFLSRRGLWRKTVVWESWCGLDSPPPRVSMTSSSCFTGGDEGRTPSERKWPDRLPACLCLPMGVFGSAGADPSPRSRPRWENGARGLGGCARGHASRHLPKESRSSTAKSCHCHLVWVKNRGSLPEIAQPVESRALSRPRFGFRRSRGVALWVTPPARAGCDSCQGGSHPDTEVFLQHTRPGGWWVKSASMQRVLGSLTFLNVSGALCWLFKYSCSDTCHLLQNEQCFVNFCNNTCWLFPRAQALS